MRRVILSAAAGTFVEYYDFAVYGALAPVLSVVFFSGADPVAGLLGTFAIFAVAFFARPLGGLLWGSVGDRIGRQRTLVVVITVMSVSTVAIGLIPSYATVGVLAPIMLLLARVVQGLSAGGEVAGAAIFIGEYAPPARRGVLVSLLNVATSTALLFGIATAALLSSVLSDEAMHSWGWRIPFLLAGPLGLVGLYIRRRLGETPAFTTVRATGRTTRSPLRTVLRDRANYGRMGAAAAFYMPTLVSFYLLLSYFPAFLTRRLGFSAGEGLLAVTIAGLVVVAMVPLSGTLSDRIGRRPVLVGTCVGFLLFTVPAFALLTGAGFGGAIMGLILLAVPTGAALGNNLAPAMERFRTNIRYTASAATLGILGALFSGSAPYVAEYLVDATSSLFAPGFYLMASVVPSLLAARFITETAGRELPH